MLRHTLYKTAKLWTIEHSVDFHTFTLQLPIQTPHSVAPELQVFASSLQNCQNFSKMGTPLLTFFACFLSMVDVCDSGLFLRKVVASRIWSGQ